MTGYDRKDGWRASVLFECSRNSQNRRRVLVAKTPEPCIGAEISGTQRARASMGVSGKKRSRS